MTYTGKEEGWAPCGKGSYKKTIKKLRLLLIVDCLGWLTYDQEPDQTLTVLMRTQSQKIIDFETSNQGNSECETIHKISSNAPCLMAEPGNRRQDEDQQPNLSGMPKSWNMDTQNLQRRRSF